VQQGKNKGKASWALEARQSWALEAKQAKHKALTIKWVMWTSVIIGFVRPM